MSVPQRTLSAVAASLLFGFVCSATHAVLVPPGLNPGDPYHLAFVTSGTRDATASDIGTYNAFVQSEAKRSGSLVAGMGINWFVIGSTFSVAARDNALCSTHRAGDVF